jgi:hypothetical protein
MMEYGWFEYDREPFRVTNYLTGQSLTVRSSHEYADGIHHGADYSDPQISQSLSFSIKNTINGARNIALDYGACFTATPAYGHWRRIDDFVVDALFCWPTFFSCPAYRLLTTGGWMIPLDTPPPKKWKFVDVESPAARATLDFGRDETTGIPYLPRDSDVSGFRGKVPFLEREDGLSYIIFSKLEPHLFRGEDPMTFMHYTYVDQDVFFRFRSTPLRGTELGTATDYGFRQWPPAQTALAGRAHGSVATTSPPLASPQTGQILHIVLPSLVAGTQRAQRCLARMGTSE